MQFPISLSSSASSSSSNLNLSLFHPILLILIFHLYCIKKHFPSLSLSLIPSTFVPPFLFFILISLPCSQTFPFLFSSLSLFFNLFFQIFSFPTQVASFYTFYNTHLAYSLWVLPIISFHHCFKIFQKEFIVGVEVELSFESSDSRIRPDKFLEVPQIVWGLNNQKIAFARACLTARMMNRTLLIPSLSASLFYKEIDLLQPISFDKVFKFDEFNTLCGGFVRLGRYADVLNRTQVLEMEKGSGRRWTMERDLAQLREYSKGSFDDHEVIRIVGKNPFLWHDHWPVKDYAKVFECLELIDEIAEEVDRVVSRIREVGKNVRGNTESLELKNNITSDKSLFQPLPYVAVHMRIEIDWMIHCKKLEQRLNTNQICSSKKEIMERVRNVVGQKTPIVVYLAVADKLLNDSSIMEDWEEGLHPFEKKKLGVTGIYNKYPYLIQSAIDYEVCSRADIFVGNSFSTFSSLIVLERTQNLIRKGVSNMCGTDARWPSYAYNIAGESNGPMRWITNMSESSLKSISYGTTHISC